MQNLQGLVESYLKSVGYNLIDVRPGFVVADRLGLSGDRDTRLHWIVTPSGREDFAALERRLLGDFVAAIAKYPRAKSWLIVPPGGGFSRNFRVESGRLGVQFTAPIDFFDAPFKHEEAPQAWSLIKSIVDSASATPRVERALKSVEK